MRLQHVPDYVRYVSLLFVIGVGTLVAACQSTMSIEEAKKVTAQFAGSSFVPPPRTIGDITAILDQQKLADPEAAAKARAKADQPPPSTTNEATLANFYYQRGLAAGEIGHTRQEMDDLTKAFELGSRAAVPNYHHIARRLAVAEILGGNVSSAEAHAQQAIALTPRDNRGALFGMYWLQAALYTWAGNLEAAENVRQQILALSDESEAWLVGARTKNFPEYIALWRSYTAATQGILAAARGRLAEAEAFHRDAIAWLEQNPVASKDPILDVQIGRLAVILAAQGRLLEAENEARRAVLSALKKHGRNSTRTANILRYLTRVISEQGRFVEAETLARAAIDIYGRIGAPSDSALLASARAELGATLVAQDRGQEGMAEFEAIRKGLAGDPQMYEKYFSGNLNWAVALLGAGQPDQALEMLRVALERTKRLLGEKHPNTAEVLGLLGMAYTARGDKPRALQEFQEATPTLLTRSPDVEDESASRPARDQRLSLILMSYIGLLADIKGTPLERQAGIDAATEAFRLADVARGRSVQRALDASATRAAAKTPALADLVRKEQDAKKQISALYGALASAITHRQDQATVAALRSQIEALRRARESLLAQIEKDFPAYAELINPKPATLEQARAALRAGEALITTLVSRDRTFVWAVPHSGPVAFVAAPLGWKTLEDSVIRLRTALNPTAKTLGDVPDFDVALGHQLYRALLEPVAAGWERAESLLFVPHGPLGQLPLSLLPTKPTMVGPEHELLFANYRAVPWLVRTHAVTVLPSVASLATVRALPPGDPTRRPFVGFGDPYFSQEQAVRAARQAPQTAVAALTPRSAPLALRSAPKTQAFDSSQLAMLPRLPDTADEIRSIAQAMNADPAKDVFLGERANESTVKTLDLSRYRVLAFATHGLVPGDLDGLTQPALALSAPDVAKVEGDGLLTMEEILALRLNADWVVLSACNTASGHGAGAEAVSGLGRAFFYAGARALLVSNWPVETTSARALTTDLFRRQQANPGLSRARALQETMTALIDDGHFTDPKTNKTVFSYAHPIFWAPFTLVGDGGGGAK